MNGTESPSSTTPTPARDGSGGSDGIELRAAVDKVRQDRLLTAVLEAVPGVACVLNAERQIVAANSRMKRAVGVDTVDELIGKRVGEALGCQNARLAPSGCGTAAACRLCGSLTAVQRAQNGVEGASEEVRLVLERDRGFAFDAEVVATQVSVGGSSFVVMCLRDSVSEGRRQVLERLFFHDMLNAAGGVKGLASMLGQGRTPEAEEEYRDLLVDLSERLIDLITQQRQLLAAESGDLQTQPTYALASSVLRQVHGVFCRHDAAQDRTLVLGEAPDVEFVTDLSLMQRVLGNMVKNALEATPPRGEVVVGARELPDAVEFIVQNPGVIPQDVAHQIFQRSFSTKGAGRGLGTYSIRLLGEGYLGGRVAFASDDKRGTTFTFTVPKAWAGKGADPDGW